MQVTSGWNLKYGEKKFSVDLDEGDLRRILIEVQADPAAAEAMLAHVAYKILYAEAQMISMEARSRLYAGDDADSTRARQGCYRAMQAFKDERDTALEPWMPAEMREAREKARAERAAAAAAAQ